VNPADYQHAPPFLLCEAEMILDLYGTIRQRAHINGMGPAPLSWQDLEAYQRVTGDRLNGWTLKALGWIDGVWLKEAFKRQKEQSKQGGK
jgi:hypothetical protein